MITNDSQELAKIEREVSISFPTVDLNTFTMDDLEEAEVMPVELTSVYWTPETIDESLRVVFLGIEKVPMLPLGSEDKSLLNEDGMVLLPCAYFLTSDDNRVIKICNSSKRLISTLQGSFIKPNTPLLITYLGKKKNKNNAFQSDSWSVKPLNPKTIFVAEKVKQDVSDNANGQEIGIDDEQEFDQAPQQQPAQQQARPVQQESATPAAGATQRRRF